MNELSREIKAAAASGSPGRARNISFAYHIQWYIPGEVFALAFFASSVAKQGLGLRLTLGVVSCGLYWILLFAGHELSRENIVPVSLGAWLPDLAFMGISAGLLSKGGES